MAATDIGAATNIRKFGAGYLMMSLCVQPSGDSAGASLLFGTATRGRVRAGLMAASLMLLATVGAAQAEGDPVAGESKAHTCLGCHGVKHYINSYPSYHVPRIAGQHAQYLVAALQAYRAKTRDHATMQANAALLSDQDIADIAAWFASQGVSN